MSDLDGLGDWRDLPFFSARWPGIKAALDDEARVILPPRPHWFEALRRTSPDATRVVILGQDPYPTRGHANGLAFSVSRGTPLPRSLANIFRELNDDIGGAPPNGDLSFWADQGVLLLNTALTVPEGDAGGHAKLGWEALTHDVITHLGKRPRAFLLWGKHAQKFGAAIAPEGGHLVLESAHPSPLSARRGFFGSKPFSQINHWLSTRGTRPIDWAGSFS